ncbi:MAG TPA: histidine kinase [Bacteroidales bacterium]|nr:histidine kinase [Bacteroidales bacterium]
MKKIVEVVLHLLFWFGILVVMPYTGYLSMIKNGYAHGISFYDFWISNEPMRSFPSFVFLMVGFYVLYFITSYGLHQKRTVRAFIYIGWSILITIPMGMILFGTDDYVIHYVFRTYYVIIFSTTGLFAAVVKGIILWLLDISEKRALQKRQLESENALLLLKAQLNPHFLFNSLNNIDILIEESPKIASDYLKKLSDILRYVLYETKEDETTLAREIEQIRNYIELQKIRTSNASYVDFEVKGEVGNQKIVPMIFLPIIENAFKFSKNKSVEHAIIIQFEVARNSVIMVCKNYFELHHINVIKNEGLGIETIRQRLNLIYPRKHLLEISDVENWFTVSLKIKLEDGD